MSGMADRVTSGKQVKEEAQNDLQLRVQADFKSRQVTCVGTQTYILDSRQKTEARHISTQSQLVWLVHASSQTSHCPLQTQATQTKSSSVGSKDEYGV
jgi:hypothetical protein